MSWRALNSIEPSEWYRSFEIAFLEFDLSDATASRIPWDTRWDRPVKEDYK